MNYTIWLNGYYHESRRARTASYRRNRYGVVHAAGGYYAGCCRSPTASEDCCVYPYDISSVKAARGREGCCAAIRATATHGRRTQRRKRRIIWECCHRSRVALAACRRGRHGVIRAAVVRYSGRYRTAVIRPPDTVAAGAGRSREGYYSAIRAAAHRRRCRHRVYGYYHG
jgi:hypothetical protein